MRRSMLFAVIAAAVSFVSCVKEVAPTIGPQPSAIVKTVSLPISFVQSDMTEEVDVKAGLGDMEDGVFPFKWNDGDVAKVFMGNKLLENPAQILVNQDDPTKGTISISFTENEIPAQESGDITLLYPGTTSSPTALIDGRVPFTLPTSQYAGPDGMPYNGWGTNNAGMGSQMLPCVASAGNALDVYNENGAKVSFKNPFALVSFKLDGTLADVKKLVFDTMYKPMGTEFRISPDGTSEWANGTYNPHIVLKAGKREGDDNAVFETGKTYYFLAPAVALQNGFVITLHKTGGQTVARGAKNPYLSLVRSAVNDLGTFTASGFTSDAGFIKTNYPFVAAKKARLAVVGSFVVVANGGTILKFYNRITGDWLRDLDLSTIGVYGNPDIDMLAVDDAGNLVFGASVANNSQYANIYYLTSSITTVQTLGSYCCSSGVTYCSGAGNLRVSGDVTKKASITLFMNGTQPMCMAFDVVNGTLGAASYKELPSNSAAVWDWGHGVVCPAGASLSNGLYYTAYNGRYHLEYASDMNSSFAVKSSTTSVEFGGNDDPNSMDIATISGKTYLAVGVGSHQTYTVPRVVVYDMSNNATVINRWNLPVTSSLTGAGPWSDVQIVPSTDGNYFIYYLSANNGYFACSKFGPDVDPGQAPEIESALKAPKVIAHRGCHGDGIPENSIAALAKAQEIKCYGSEVDVWITTDDKIVCFHDATLTHNGTEYNVKNSTYEQIKDYTLSNGEKLPTFEAMLDQLGKSSDTKLILEFKHHWNNERESLAVRKAIEMIKAKGLSHMVDYIAFNYETCKLAAQLMPTAEVSFLAYDAATPEPDSSLKNDGIDCIDYSYLLFQNNPKWISKAHALNMKVNIWTLNTEAEFLTWIRQGVDYITTDQPVLLQQVISQYCAQ